MLKTLLAFVILTFPSFLYGKSDKAPNPRQVFIDLNSQDFSKRNQAKRELRLLRFKDVAKVMGDYFDDPNPEIRVLMIQTLGELGGFESAKMLKKLYFKEKDDRVRRAIFVQLSGLLADEGDAIKFLKEVILNDSNSDIRFLAIHQLDILAGSASKKSKLSSIYEKAWDKETDTRNAVLIALTLKELGKDDPKINNYAFSAIQSPLVEVRRRAVTMIDATEDPELLKIISAAVNDNDPEVRANLCKSLQNYKNKFGINLLKTLAKDRNVEVRKNALDIIAGFPRSDETTSIIMDAFQDPEDSVRVLAITFIERLREPLAIPALEKISQQDPVLEARFLAKKALATIRSKQ